MRATPLNFKADNSLIQIWYHEVRRVFEDRFINDDDTNVFRGMVR